MGWEGSPKIAIFALYNMCTAPMTLLCTTYYQNWSMSVEDIANQI